MVDCADTCNTVRSVANGSDGRRGCPGSRWCAATARLTLAGMPKSGCPGRKDFGGRSPLVDTRPQRRRGLVEQLYGRLLRFLHVEGGVDVVDGVRPALCDCG